MARQPLNCGCDDFRATSESTRRRFVGDSRLTRRQVLSWGAGAGLSLYAARAMPISRALEAAAADAAAAPDAPVLVAVFLPGGLDLLDSLIPANDYGAYADLHRNIRVDKPPLLRGSALGIHPSLAQGVGGGIKGLYDAGKLGFLPGIDYPNPNLSHFHSRHFWETGLIVDSGSPGWLGRWLDANGNAGNPLQGMSLGYGLSPVHALAQRAGRVGQLAGQRGLLHPRHVRRAVRRGDEDVGGARADARRRARAEGRQARGVSRQAGRRPARAVREDEGRRPARVERRLSRQQHVRQPPAHAGGAHREAARHPRRDGRRAQRLRHALQPAQRAEPGAARDQPGARRLPGRPRGARRRRPRADVRLVGVRPPPARQRLGHRPRRRRPGLGAGHAGAQRPAQRVPVAARVRRRRQPQGDGRLPHGLRVA